MMITTNNQKMACPKCQELYDLTEFYTIWNGKINYFSSCHRCQNIERTQQHKILSETKIPKVLMSCISSTIRNELSKHTFFCLKEQNYFQFLPYSLEELKIHLENQFESWMSWNNWGKYVPKFWDDSDSSTWKWQLDHIIPRSLFRYSTVHDSNFYSCWDLNNIRPLSAKQNVLDGVKKVRHI
jgi:hypothetical protein